MVFWAAVTLLAGAALAIQARMNGELSEVWGRGLDAALWSFGSGLVVLTLAAALFPPLRVGVGRLRTALHRGEIRRWQLLGGLVGALFVFAQSYAVPIVGVALFTIATVGGQTASAVVVDRLGLGPTGRVAVSRVRVIAAVLAPFGVVVAVGGRVSATDAAAVLPALLALVVAAFVSVQQATNGRVTVASGQPMTTAWLNFAMGTVMLLVLTVPAWVLGSFGVPARGEVPWWAWFGGVFGIFVVSATAVAVRHLGVLLVILLMLAGQLAAAVVLDALDPETRGQITPVVVLGLLVTVAAAVLAAVAATRAQRRSTDALEPDAPMAG